MPCCVHLSFHTGPHAPTLPCAPRGRLERGTNSAAVESMTSAMSVAMLLVQVSSGIGGSAATIAFVIWHRGFGSVINRLRSASFGISMVLSLFLRFGADLRIAVAFSPILCMYVCMVITYSKTKDQTGEVTNPARSAERTEKMNNSLSPFAP